MTLEPPPTARKKPLGKILALVAAAVVAIIVVASIMTPKQISVPDLSGSTLADATAKLQALNLAVGQKTLREDSTKDPNVVLSQSPSPNTRVKAGSTVDLVLSQASVVEVPALVGESLDDARRTLADRQLQLGGIERQPKAGVARDTVLREFPLAGEKVKGGSKVDLMVSDVPENPAPEPARGGSERKASAPAPSEKVTASSNVRQTQPPAEQSTSATSQSRPVQNATEPPAEVVKPIPQVVNVAGIWHDVAGNTFRVTQRGNTFTYTASSPSVISEGGGTISGLEFESYYRTAYVNGVRIARTLHRSDRCRRKHDQEQLPRLGLWGDDQRSQLDSITGGKTTDGAAICPPPRQTGRWPADPRRTSPPGRDALPPPPSNRF